MEVQFFIIDLNCIGASKELRAYSWQNIKNALKQYSYIKACNPGKDVQVVSIIAINNTKVETILSPQRFHLINFVNSVEQLECDSDAEISKLNSIQQGVSALLLASKSINQIKKKYNEFSLTTRIANFSSTWVPECEPLSSIMKGLSDNDAEIHFYHIEFPDNIDVDGFTNFLLLSKQWINCLLTRIGYDEYSILEAVMSLTVPPLYITSLKLVLPSQEEITCDLHRPLYDLSNISQVDLCPCHGKRLFTPVDSSSCSVSGKALLPYKLLSAFHLGSLIIRISNAPKSVRSVELNVIKRLKLESVSELLLFGEPYVISSSRDEFYAFFTLLSEKEEGLLASTHYDVDSGKRIFMRQYFLIFPSTNGFMLLKKIATAEHMKPTPSILFKPPSEESLKIVTKAFNSIESVNYNPLDFNGTLFESLDRAISTNPPPVKKRIEVQEREEELPMTQASQSVIPITVPDSQIGQPTPAPKKGKKLLHPSRRIVLD